MDVSVARVASGIHTNITTDMPAKAVLFDQRVRVVHDFGSHPINFISYNPQSRLVALAGFGNLAGKVEIYDRRSLAKVTTIDAPNTSWCEWSPCGRFLLTATLSPRLRVDNGVKIWHCTGSLIHVQLEEELYQVRTSHSNSLVYSLNFNHRHHGDPSRLEQPLRLDRSFPPRLSRVQAWPSWPLPSQQVSCLYAHALTTHPNLHLQLPNPLARIAHLAPAGSLRLPSSSVKMKVGQPTSPPTGHPHPLARDPTDKAIDSTVMGRVCGDMFLARLRPRHRPLPSLKKNAKRAKRTNLLLSRVALRHLWKRWWRRLLPRSL